MFNSETKNLPKLKYIVIHSKNTYAQYLGASALKSMLVEKWSMIEFKDKIDLKRYLIEYLQSSCVL